MIEEVRKVLPDRGPALDGIEDGSALVGPGSGLLDSLRFLELVGAVEREFTTTFDFSDLDPAEFTTLGGFVAHAARSARRAARPAS